jgi:hypothetical protein
MVGISNFFKELDIC